MSLRSRPDAKTRTGLLCLALALLMFSAFVSHNPVIHFLRGFFLGLSLVLLLRGLYKMRRPQSSC